MTLTSYLDAVERRIEREPMSGCWIWMGTWSTKGYGQFRWPSGRWQAAHRVVYELQRGAIRPGLQLDHLCLVKACVNPAHLESVTGRVNVLRAENTVTGINARKALCPVGHPYALHVRITNGKRHCKACGREDAKRRYWIGKTKAVQWPCPRHGQCRGCVVAQKATP